ncbi:DUF6046 domain-containing protein [Sulfidibacter corallicola]|uniref:DNA circularisation protein N-terminus n=1 Tax=Sulfidibacter corallicola TaxID=2818388 RepID=A0A8A4TQ92_SULCO|nr:hypothetical protein [Sulfidibacter corallicola]QTD51354.1 hypothetical protein J3U87_02700 [Sulfidibacter corallicola]
MNVKPLLDNWEIPRISRIETLEHRHFAEFPVPGRIGSLFQDLDTAPTGILIEGSLYGDEARDTFLESLREKYKAGEPMTFVADILTATEVQYVVVTRLHMCESSADPDVIHYRIHLHESPPPPPDPDPFGDLDLGLLDLAGDFLDSLSGALDLLDGLGSIPDIGDPTPPLTQAVDGITNATSGLGDALEPFKTIFGSDT